MIFAPGGASRMIGGMSTFVQHSHACVCWFTRSCEHGPGGRATATSPMEWRSSENQSSQFHVPPAAFGRTLS